MAYLDISRNTIVFYLKMKNAFSLYNSFYADWKASNFILQGNEKGNKVDTGAFKMTWFPPKEGFMKLNIDSTWKYVNEAGGGGVFRRPAGSWFLGFSSKFNVHSPSAAVLYALREGLMIAKDFMIDKLKVETDALNLKLLLEKVNDQSHHDLGPVLREVAQLLGQSWIISFTHIPHFCNKVAHSLTTHFSGDGYWSQAPLHYPFIF